MRLFSALMVAAATTSVAWTSPAMGKDEGCSGVVRNLVFFQYEGTPSSRYSYAGVDVAGVCSIELVAQLFVRLDNNGGIGLGQLLSAAAASGRPISVTFNDTPVPEWGDPPAMQGYRIMRVNMPEGLDRETPYRTRHQEMGEFLLGFSGAPQPTAAAPLGSAPPR